MDKQKTKERLIRASALLFSKNSFSDVTTRQIADKANANISAIKYYFGSKENLFIEMIKTLLNELSGENYIQNFDENLLSNDKENAKKAFRKLIEDFVHTIYVPDLKTEHPCKMMCREILNINKNNKKLCDEMVAIMSKDFIVPFEKVVRKILKVISPSLTEQEIKYTIGVINAMCSHHLISGEFIKRVHGEDFISKENIKNYANFIIDFTLKGLN